jgi:regulator of protease activity HflC (stomatin/prohibitin superfamily)
MDIGYSLLTVIGCGIGVLVCGVLLIGALFGTIVLVPEKTRVLITLFGQYKRTATSSPTIKWPFFGGTVEVDMAIRQHTVTCTPTISKDKVTVTPQITVQYQVVVGKERAAHYNMQGGVLQFIEAAVDNTSRYVVPGLLLDEVLDHPDHICSKVQEDLEAAFQSAEGGYQVHKVLVTAVKYDPEVEKQMNRINAAQRAQVAAVAEAAAYKTLELAKSEVEKQSMINRGQGIAGERDAIFESIEKSAEKLQAAYPGATAADLISLVLNTNNIDMLKRWADGPNAKVVLLPGVSTGAGTAPQAPNSIADQVRDGVIAALTALDRENAATSA